MNAHSLGVIILLLIALRCHLGDWTQAALKSWLGGGRRLAIQPDLHLSRFAHLRLIKPDALTAAAGALADSVVPKFEVMEVRGPGRPGPYQASTELIPEEGSSPGFDIANLCGCRFRVVWKLRGSIFESPRQLSALAQAVKKVAEVRRFRLSRSQFLPAIRWSRASSGASATLSVMRHDRRRGRAGRDG
jgi:hypothetical protein